jgi:hypothetical protein
MESTELLLSEMEALADEVERGLTALILLCALGKEKLPRREIQAIRDTLDLDWSLGIDEPLSGHDIEQVEMVRAFRNNGFRCAVCELDLPITTHWRPTNLLPMLAAARLDDAPVCDSCAWEAGDNE